MPWLKRFAVHAVPTILIGFAILATDSMLLATAWFVASRLAYVLFVALSLRAESKTRALSRETGPEAAWERFSSRSSWLMTNDGVAFCTLCVATSGTLALPFSAWFAFAAGVALAALGIGVKVWAARSLSPGSYYWRSFFVPSDETGLSERGPYRWLANPMYTIGYAHVYGLALGVRSSWGLVGAAFAQTAILALNYFVETPHVREMDRE